MSDLLTSFTDFYRQFDQCSLDRLNDLYDEQVVFKDPLHTLQGRRTVQDYFDKLCQDLSRCRFEFTSEVHGNQAVFYRWNMHYQHPRLGGNKPLVLEGGSLIEFSDKITRHEDFYDMGAMLYEHVPVVGGAIRLLKRRLANSAA